MKMSARLMFTALAFSAVSVVTCVKEFRIDKEFKTLNTLDKLKYRDCYDVRSNGRYKESGAYTIFLNTSTPFTVTCQFELNNTFTTIMQQKYGGENFQRGWSEYENGFGHQSSGDFWIGLSHMKLLSDIHYNVLTVTLQDWANTIKVLQYRNFYLGSQSDRYRLYLSSYVSSQVLPDDFSHNNGMQFSTYDAPDRHNCAVNQRGGWWYNYCTLALPTGKYYKNGPYVPVHYYDGIYYKDWKGFNYSLKYIRMDLSVN